MAKDSAGAPSEDADGGNVIDRRKRRKERSNEDDSGESDRGRDRRRSRRSRERRRRRKSESDDEESSSSSSYSDSGSESESEESEEDEKRRRRKERRRREREEEERRERKRRKDKKRRRKEEEEKKRKEKKRKKDKELGKTGAVTNSWGKYGVIREIDMWQGISAEKEKTGVSGASEQRRLHPLHLSRNKRPEFSAWLAEVKQVNLETLSNWEEKQLFKEFMEDHNTATFPSKKYYDLNAYHRRQLEKEMKKGGKKARETERTVFNDEEQRRKELLIERERLKEEQVQALKHSMQSGMAQAMKEQAQLREEMAYQYKVGNFEAAAAIQRRLDPDAAI